MSDETPQSGPSWMGCLIPITAAVVLLGLGTCTVVTGLMQNRAIAGFTDEEPQAFGKQAQLLTEGEAEVLQAKLSSLKSAADVFRKTEVVLSRDELNHLIQTASTLESLRESTYVRAITESGLEVESSQPMRKLGKGSRYLNGIFVFVPVESGSNEWQLEFQDLRVPDREIPEGFLSMARELGLFRFDVGQEELQSVLRQVESVKMRPGELVVSTQEGEAATDG